MELEPVAKKLELVEVRVLAIGRSGWYRDGQLLTTLPIMEPVGAELVLPQLLGALGYEYLTVYKHAQIKNEAGDIGRFPYLLQIACGWAKKGDPGLSAEG